MEKIIELLKQFKEGKIGMEEIIAFLSKLPYESISGNFPFPFGRIDHHRVVRRGFPEVIYGGGKSFEQIFAIVEAMVKVGSSVLITRLGKEIGSELLKHFPEGRYYPEARIWMLKNSEKEIRPGYVAVVTGGTLDINVAEEAAVTAEFLGSPVKRFYDVGVAGIHRLFDILDDLRKASSVIVVAGMEGALPSVVAGLIDGPVIAVPTSVGYGAHFGGLVPLLSALNSCSPGVVVVNIDNGFGAGYVASLIHRKIVVSKEGKNYE